MNRLEHEERELAKKLVRHLDGGVDRLEPGVRGRLQSARNAALSRYRDRPQSVPGLAWAGQAARFADHHFPGARNRVVVAALALVLAGFAYWQWQRNGAPAADIAAIDASLLTDELPLNAYLDKGFDTWLKRSSR
jgi:hypothetical protein